MSACARSAIHMCDTMWLFVNSSSHISDLWHGISR